MKANKLMIGDWMAHYNDTPMQVSVVKQDCFACSNQPYLYNYNNEFSPIPITPEILEANGIPINGDTFIFEEDEDCKLELVYENGQLGWSINAEYIIIYFMYVHELQHALRLCGLGEIADHFKLK